MTAADILKELEKLSDVKTSAHNLKSGVTGAQFGVKLGDIRKVAKKVKVNKQAVALELWATDIFDAQMLSILIINPNKLSASELDNMVRSVHYDRVADWLNSYVVKLHSENESLRLKWMQDENPMAARAGWNLTKQRIVRNPEMVDISALLDRIEAEMLTTSPTAQWTMNFCLAEIGIHHKDYRKRALEIGEKLGLYRDYPTSKGCTSPFAPIWINEMVSREEKVQA
tara:strand:+ start:20793 stop:21473 length:681 start_codon:yes stop_codon:yes gene_type:complete